VLLTSIRLTEEELEFRIQSPRVESVDSRLLKLEFEAALRGFLRPTLPALSARLDTIHFQLSAVNCVLSNGALICRI
jgi:hypothetical protein